jgi:hypothetical protein
MAGWLIWFAYQKLRDPTFTDPDSILFFLELSKSAFRVLSVLIIGTVLTQAVKAFETSRRRDKVIHDYRMEFLKELQAIYQEVQIARYQLRVAGLAAELRTASALGKEDSDCYLKILPNIHAALLRLQRQKMEVQLLPGTFRNETRQGLANKLDELETFLQGVVDESEKHQKQIAVQPHAVQFAQLKKLNGLTADHAIASIDNTFQGNFAPVYQRAIILVQQELLPIRRTVS